MSRFSTAGLPAVTLAAQGVPDDPVADQFPPVPGLRRKAAPHLEFQTVNFQPWRRQRRDTLQLHPFQLPGGGRERLTFLPEPVAGAGLQPQNGRYIAFGQDIGGGEIFQDYRCRRNPRRAECGNERDPAMRAFWEKIAPLNNVRKRLMPVTEADQMVKMLRARGGTGLYLMAKDESRSFQRRTPTFISATQSAFLGVFCRSSCRVA